MTAFPQSPAAAYRRAGRAAGRPRLTTTPGHAPAARSLRGAPHAAHTSVSRLMTPPFRFHRGSRKHALRKASITPALKPVTYSKGTSYWRASRRWCATSSSGSRPRCRATSTTRTCTRRAVTACSGAHISSITAQGRWVEPLRGGTLHQGAVLDQLRALDWVSRSMRRKARHLDSITHKLDQRLGRAASEDEVARDRRCRAPSSCRLLSALLCQRRAGVARRSRSARPALDARRPPAGSGALDVRGAAGGRAVAARHPAHARPAARAGAPGGFALLLRAPDAEPEIGRALGISGQVS